MASEEKAVSVREQIPKAEFIEDLTAYMKKEGTAEVVIEKLQRMYQALKFIEQKLTQRKAKLKSKIPEIENTFGALKQMQAQAEVGEPLTAHYELAQSVYAKAKVNVHEEDKVRQAGLESALCPVTTQPAWWLQGRRPLLLAPERCLSAPEACGGLRSSPSPAVPKLRCFHSVRRMACAGYPTLPRAGLPVARCQRDARVPARGGDPAAR